jgi:hypothetical protein
VPARLSADLGPRSLSVITLQSCSNTTMTASTELSSCPVAALHAVAHLEPKLVVLGGSGHTALEKVAVMSDEIAERVGLHATQPQEVPFIPGRTRWTVSYRGGEIVKPLRRQMKVLAKIRHNEIYCAETREGGLEAAEPKKRTGMRLQRAGGPTQLLSGPTMRWLDRATIGS